VREHDDVPEAEKRRRFHVINNRQQREQERRNTAFVGTTQRVLIDTVRESRLAGRTPHNRIVHCDAPGGPDAPEAWIGRTVDVTIEHSYANSLAGRVAFC